MPAAREQSRRGLADALLSEAKKRSIDEYARSVPLVVGVSGGADSLAMLHLLRSIRGESAPATLHVAHLNHWFRGKEAREDADFVREISIAWGLDCVVEDLDVPNYARHHKLSVEDAARRVRYAFLAGLAAERGAGVAVAHNADDQVETVLMSLLRGTGLSGLAGMQMLSTLPLSREDDLPPIFPVPPVGQKIALFRPILPFWRHEIVTYCQQTGLRPRFDSTNWERTYRRNRVRHDLIPLLQLQYSLAIKEHLFNLAEIAGAEDELLEVLTESEWQQVARTEGEDALVDFDMADFAALPEAMRRRLVRYTIKKLAGTVQDITFAHVEAAVRLLSGTPGTTISIDLPHGLVVKREQTHGIIALRHTTLSGRYYVKTAGGRWPIMQQSGASPLRPGELIKLDSGWVLKVDLHPAGAKRRKPGELIAFYDRDALAALGNMIVRTRRPGDTIQPLGMAGHRSLQDLMVDAKIPRELRDRLPVVALEGSHDVLWVPGPGGRRSDHAMVDESTQHVISLEFRKPE